MKRLNLGKNILLLQEDEEITVKDDTSPEIYNTEPKKTEPTNAFGLPVKKRFNFAQYSKPTIKQRKDLV